MSSYYSPAKINLFLRVIRRRPDGFQELASLFQTISLCDILDIKPIEHNSHDQLTCTDPTIPTDDNNLVLKAVNLFRRKTGLTFHVDIHLTKNIPHQAGLGGGSSNAATTLWALNELLNSPATLPQLMEWGAELGSDVPFFFSSGIAYCTGRGEIIQSMPPLPKTPVTIVKPKEGLSTPLIFKALDLNETSKTDPQLILDSFYTNAPIYVNDLETPAFKIMPRIGQLKIELLEKGFETVLMTGSGSAFFCIGEKVKFPLDLHIKTEEKVHFLVRQNDSWYHP